MAFACVLAIALLPACKDGVTDLDLGLKGPGDLSSAEVADSFSVTGYNVLPDQGNLSSDDGRLVMAWRNDIRTGEMMSTGNFELRLPEVKAPAPRLAAGRTPTLLKIAFPYSITEADVAQMDAVFSLYQLDQGYDINKIYFTNDRFPIKTYGADSLLAQVRLSRIDTLGSKLSSLKTARFELGADSPVTQAVMEYISQKGWTANDLEFVNLLKGFAIRMETFRTGTNERVPAVVNLTVGASSQASLRYWHTIKTPPRGVFQRDSLVKDSVALQLDASCRHHTSVWVNRVGSEFAANMQPGDSNRLTDPVRHRLYLQGGRPIWAHVDMPGLNDFLAKEKNIIILRAELLLPNDNGAPLPKPNSSILAYRGKPDPLQLSRNNLNTNGIPNEDLQGTAINYFYDSTAARYTVNITPFVLGVAAGKEANQGVTLSVSASNHSYRTFTFNTNRSNTPDTRARLRIYFVRPNAGG